MDMFVQTKVFCVLIRRKDGTYFLANNQDGAAVYFDRERAYEFSYELRHGIPRFQAKVVAANVIIPLHEMEKGKRGA